ncbi:StfH/YfcO family fimbrial adhesin, partial [Escherichia sp. SS-MK2]
MGSVCSITPPVDCNLTTSGCDNAKVTVTPEPQPITSRQLHD